MLTEGGAGGALCRATLKSAGGVLKLPLIKNKKTVNPRDASTPPVFQLETAMGSAIECFDDAGAVVVPRERFAPVKTCNDLFVLRSDAYKVPVAPVCTILPAETHGMLSAGIWHSHAGLRIHAQAACCNDVFRLQPCMLWVCLCCNDAAQSYRPLTGQAGPFSSPRHGCLQP